MSTLNKKHTTLMDVVKDTKESKVKKYLARVEDINDPKKIGRVKVRVIDVHHPSKKVLPTEDLPWSSTNLKPGSGGGKGETSNFLIDQTVWVEPLNNSMTEWRVLGNAPVKPKPTTSDKAWGDVDPEGSNKRIDNEEVFHPVCTVNIPKISNTLTGACQKACVALYTCKAGPCTSSPSLPPPSECPDDAFKCTEQDWSTLESRYINQYGGRIGNVHMGVLIDGRQARPEDVYIELVPDPVTGLIGGVNGLSLEEQGKKLYIYWDPKTYEIVFPSVLPEGKIEVIYKATLKAKPTLVCQSRVYVTVKHQTTVVTLTRPTTNSPSTTPSITTTTTTSILDTNIPELPDVFGQLVGAKDFLRSKYESLCGGINNALNDLLGTVLDPLKNIMDSGLSLISDIQDQVDSALKNIEDKIHSEIDRVMGKVIDKSLWDTIDEVNLIVNEMQKTSDQLLEIANNPMSLVNGCININTPFVPFTIVEPKPTPEKGKYPFVKVDDNGGTTIVNDATDGNIVYEITHNFKGMMDSISSILPFAGTTNPTSVTRVPLKPIYSTISSPNGLVKGQINTFLIDLFGTASKIAQRANKKVDPEGTSRLAFTNKGEAVFKSADDMYLISRKNSNEVVEGHKHSQIKGRHAIDCPIVTFSGDVRIEGNLIVLKNTSLMTGLTVVKNATVLGNFVAEKGIQTQGEIFASKSIRSANFVHGQYGIRSNVPGEVLPVYKGPKFKDGYLKTSDDS